jgi:hypothetical protein
MKKLLFTLALLFSCTFCFGQTPFLGQNIDTVQYNINLVSKNLPVTYINKTDSTFAFVYDFECKTDLYNLYIKDSVVNKLFCVHTGDLDVLQPEFENLLASRKYVYLPKYNIYCCEIGNVQYRLTKLDKSKDDITKYRFIEIAIKK